MWEKFIPLSRELAHRRKSCPESGHGFPIKKLGNLCGVPFSLSSGLLFIVYFVWLIVNCLLFIMYCLFFIFHCLIFALLFVSVSCFLFLVYCLLLSVSVFGLWGSGWGIGVGTRTAGCRCVPSATHPPAPMLWLQDGSGLWFGTLGVHLTRSVLKSIFFIPSCTNSLGSGSWFKNNNFAEMWSGFEEVSYPRRMDLCITQLYAREQ